MPYSLATKGVGHCNSTYRSERGSLIQRLYASAMLDATHLRSPSLDGK